MKNNQATINFPIRSANGKGYAVYLSESGETASYARHENVDYNAKSAHIKGLKTAGSYYAVITYSQNGKITQQSKPVKIVVPK